MIRSTDSRGLAAALIGMGLLLLVLRYFGGFAGTVWPLFVIVPGAALLVLAAYGTWRSKYLAASGAVVTGIGVILAVQNATDYFQSWAYAWALLPVFAGAGYWMIGEREHDATAKAAGRNLMQWGVVVFIVLAAMFELFIFSRGWFDAGLVLALILIAAGAFLLFYHRGGPPARAGGA